MALCSGDTVKGSDWTEITCEKLWLYILLILSKDQTENEITCEKLCLYVLVILSKDLTGMRKRVRGYGYMFL